jgi:hypothetical protein
MVSTCERVVEPPSRCRVPVRNPRASGTPRNHAHALIDTQRNHLALFLAIHQVVVILHGDEAMPAVLLGQIQRLRKLPRRHAAGAQIAHLAARTSESSASSVSSIGVLKSQRWI